MENGYKKPQYQLSCSPTLLIMSILFSNILGLANSADDSSAGGLGSKCSTEFQKVMECLPFVTNKANVPTQKCCDSATELKSNNPTCLCYIIQQIHNGSNAAVKSMGMQETRLIQLPSACKMANASVSECPKLLHLAPNSTDAAIFTNTSIVTTTPPGNASPTTPSGNSKSGSFSYKSPQFVNCLIIISMGITFFHALSMAA